MEQIHLCGPFSNGSRKCCKYCRHFFLWGVSAGHCGVIKDDVLTMDDACEHFEEIEGEPEELY